MIRVLAIACTLVAVSMTAASARANLLVDPTGGTTIPLAGDDATTTRNLGGSFSYYGTTYTSLAASTNGNLNTSGSARFSDSPLSGLGGFIAPFYDDLYVSGDATSYVTEKVVAGQYYAATWVSAFDLSSILPGTGNTFQAVLFTGAATLNGFAFQAGDIAFSYSTLNAPFSRGTATVGIANLTGSSTAPLPGTTDGQISNYNLLPTGSSFLLFRPDATQTTYAASIVTPGTGTVPEPSSAVLCGIAGLAGLVAARARRPKHAA